VNVPPYSALDPFLVPDGPYAIIGHHFSNGPTWLEGFARYLALAGSAQPAFSDENKKATNYAVGGARAVANYPCRFNLPEQLQTYLIDYRRTSSNTLITLEIGGNDVRDALFAAAANQDPAPYIENAIKSVGDTLYALYMHGARQFLVLNVPDLGKTPAVRMIPGASGSASLLTNIFNENLLTVLRSINKLPGSTVKVLNIKGKLDDVIQHADDYGFTNATEACIKPNQAPFQCDNPDGFVFWDGIHPTEAMHEIVAQQAMSIETAHK
jgi:phospholipase/lecithinase/hemolysin